MIKCFNSEKEFWDYQKRMARMMGERNITVAREKGGADFKEYLAALPALEKASVHLEKITDRPLGEPARKQVMENLIHLRGFFSIMPEELTSTLRDPQHSDSDDEMYDNLLAHVSSIMGWMKIESGEGGQIKRDSFSHLHFVIVPALEIIGKREIELRKKPLPFTAQVREKIHEDTKVLRDILSEWPEVNTIGLICLNPHDDRELHKTLQDHIAMVIPLVQQLVNMEIERADGEIEQRRVAQNPTVNAAPTASAWKTQMRGVFNSGFGVVVPCAGVLSILLDVLGSHQGFVLGWIVTVFVFVLPALLVRLAGYAPLKTWVAVGWCVAAYFGWFAVHALLSDAPPRPSLLTVASLWICWRLLSACPSNNSG